MRKKKIVKTKSHAKQAPDKDALYYAKRSVIALIALFFVILFFLLLLPKKPDVIKGVTYDLKYPGISHYSQVPRSTYENDFKLTEKRMSLKSFIKDIEKQTGLQHRLYHCGTGANILYGGSPMLGIRFHERTLIKAPKIASPSAQRDGDTTRRPLARR